MKRIVTDASVALKWYLPDEDLGEQAIGILEKHVSGEHQILAPFLLEYEIMNGLSIAGRMGRVRQEKILSVMDGFFSLDIEMLGLEWFFSQVLHYCKKYNRSAYDASYLAVAHEFAIPMVTADKRLFNAVKRDLKWVKWLGDMVCYKQ